ncbi:MAG: DeoR family transcriptional regulator [bacterium]|nr:DeoR family transcriptional regulator [bacterium]
MSMPSFKDTAQDLVYALIQLSASIQRFYLRTEIEKLAFELLEDISRVSVSYSMDNVEKAVSDITALDSIVRVGYSLYEIELVNATLLIEELDKLDAAMRQCAHNTAILNNTAKRELPKKQLLDSFKSKKVEVVRDPEIEKVNKEIETIVEETAVEVSHQAIVINRQESSKDDSNINVAIRQSAIINRIKSGNEGGCRLKDLIAEFPDVSERTIRYDLRHLCEGGIIERVGNGGPASYYRIHRSIEFEQNQLSGANSSQIQGTRRKS